MKQTLSNDSWIWVIISNPGNSEEILGQLDPDNNVKYIPSFYEKEAALMCINLFSKEKGTKYEAQAIILEDLLNHSSENGFMVFMLNNEGEVQERLPRS